MKKTITRNLTIEIAVLLLTVLAMLFFCSYYIVSRMIFDEVGHYTKAIDGIYADVINAEASGMHLPINKAFADEYQLYGEYICNWYRVDYAFLLAADPENETIELLGLAQKEGIYDMPPVGSAPGEVVAHHFSEEELALLNGDLVYLVSDSKRFENSQDTAIAITDSFGNRILVVVGVSLQEIHHSIWERFRTVALILLAIFSCIILALYFIIRKNVLRPARSISQAMEDYITNGKRSKEKLEINGAEEFAMIASAFNSMTDDISAYIRDIHSFTRAQERQKTEIEIAANIQKGFLQPEHYSAPNCEVRAAMIPAIDVGGDLYDYLPLDDDRVLITIADVSGKGIPAAIFMAVTLILIRQFGKVGQEPAQILKSVNDVLSEHNPGMLFATAFVGIYNHKTKLLTYSNAGHNLPYLLRDKPLLLDQAQNMLLGLYGNEVYTQAQTELQTGDILFLYTDGVNESTNAAREFFGTERLETVLSGFRATHEENLVEYMERTVRQFAGDSPQSDDITMLALTVKRYAEFELLPELEEFDAIRQTILDSSLPRDFQLALCVAAEEIFVNICDYAFEGQEKSPVHFTFAHFDRVFMQFEDRGIAYNPLVSVITPDEYDMDTQTGGLGKLIAFSVADDVHYENRDGKNILTIIKYLQEAQTK